MCAECGMNPCHPRCPNAPEPVPVHECVDDMSAEEILKLCGESLTEAEKEER